jgi:diphthamide biosynthesis protein 7
MSDPFNPPSLDSSDTIYSADSIEFCPFESHSHLFACGTYQLAKDESEDEPAPAAPEPTASDTDANSSDDDEPNKVDKPMLRLGRLLVYAVEGESDDTFKL